MAFRRSRSRPTVPSAGRRLTSAVGDFTGATARWVSRQPKAQGVPVYVARARQAAAGTLGVAGAKAGATAAAARARGARAASATRSGLMNLALLGALLWWVDRTLTADE